MSKGLYRAWKGIRKPQPKPTQKHENKKQKLRDNNMKFNKHVVLRGNLDEYD